MEKPNEPEKPGTDPVPKENPLSIENPLPIGNPLPVGNPHPPKGEPTLPLAGAETTLNSTVFPRGAEPIPQIPGYNVVGELGRGAMGVVYEARQTNLNRPVAIKVLASSLESQIQRFELEARALGRIRDDGIIRIFDVGVWQGRPYLVMELVRGGTLSQAIAGHVIDPIEAAIIVRQMALALEAAHAAGILHRDLKPGNVMLSEPPPKADHNGKARLGKIHIKLGDFGLAKEIDGEASLGLTQTGAVMGTPGYMAPEQALGCNRTLTPATDIHALGAILYELLAGNPPYRGESALETIRMVSEIDPVTPSKVRSGIPFDLETICLKCLSKSPVKRYATARELIDDLDAFLDHRPIRARRASPLELAAKWCVRNPAFAASLGFIIAGMVAALSLGAFIASQRFRIQNENLVGLQENLGLERVRSNDITKASIWFAAALKRETRPDRQALARLRIGAMNDGFPWIRSYVVHEQAVVGADWSPSGLKYLSFGDDRVIKLNDPMGFHYPTVAKTSLKRSGTDPDGGIQAVRFLTDSLILILDESEELYSWSGHDGEEPVPLATGVTALGVDPVRGLAAIALGEEGLLVKFQASEVDAGAIARAKSRGVSLKGPVEELAFLAPGQGIVARLDAALKKVDEKGAVVSFEDLKATITCMAVTANGKTIAAANDKGDVRIWNSDSLKPKVGRFGHQEKVSCLAFSPDGSLLASGSIDQHVSVREADTGNLKYQVSHEGDVKCLAFSADPAWLFTGAEDNTIRIWHAESGRAASSQLVYNATISGVYPHPRAPIFLGTSADNTCCLWDLRPKNKISLRLGESMDQFLTGRGHTHDLLIVRSGEQVRVGSPQPFARAFADEPGRYVRFDEKAFRQSLVTVPVKAKHAALAPGAGLLVLGSDGSVSLWNDDGSHAKTLLPADKARQTADKITGSSLGKFFLLESPAKGHHKKLDLFTSGGLQVNVANLAHVRCWAFSPDDSKLAIGEGKGRLVISETALSDPAKPNRFIEPGQPAHKGGIVSLAFSPDGNWVATGGEDMRIRLWNAETAAPGPWKSQTPEMDDGPPNHASAVGIVAFDSSGKRILSGAQDNTLRLWNAASGEAIGGPILHNSSIDSLLYWHRGALSHRPLDLAATTTTEGAVYLWDLKYGQLLAPIIEPLGYSLCGFSFLEHAGGEPVVILGCSMGTITAQRLQKAPDWATPDQLREFAEYHPAFALNQEGTLLLPISGYQIPKLMRKVLDDFRQEYAPLPAPFPSSSSPLSQESSP